MQGIHFCRGSILFSRNRARVTSSINWIDIANIKLENVYGLNWPLILHKYISLHFRDAKASIESISGLLVDHDTDTIHELIKQRFKHLSKSANK